MSGLVGSLLGLGNPLLDVCADVDQQFLDQYDVSDDLMLQNVAACVKQSSA